MGFLEEGRGKLLKLLRRQVRLHPCMEVRDVYKLLYQAAFGCEHMVRDVGAARRALQHEFASLVDPMEGELMVEGIDPSGVVCRINLRPYKAIGGDVSSLLEAMARSSEGRAAGSERFSAWWRMFREAVEAGELPFSVRDVEVFEAEHVRESLSPVSHSPAYKEANRPSYRVVRVGALPEMGLGRGERPPKG